MNARDLMCSEVLACGPDDTLECAARIMWEHDCGSVPVVDDAQRVVGVITDRDACMAAWTQGLRLAEIPVRNAMSQQVHTCSEQDSLQAVEGVMREHRVRRVPIVDGESHLVGIVSLNDLVLAAMDALGNPGADVTAERIVLTLGNVCQPRASKESAQPSSEQAAQDGETTAQDGRSASSAGAVESAGPTASGGKRQAASVRNRATQTASGGD